MAMEKRKKKQGEVKKYESKEQIESSLKSQFNTDDIEIDLWKNI